MTAGSLSAVASDLISLLSEQAPTALAANSIGQIYKNWVNARVEEAREILLSEIRSGDRLDGDFDKDTLCSLIFQYLVAVRQGASRRNLRLMAQIIRTGSTREIELEADELAASATMVSQLTRPEINLLAALWRNHPNGCRAKSEEEKLQIYNSVVAELVPSYFADKEELMSTAFALTRTGLVLVPAVWGGNRIDVSPRFYLLMKLCRIEDSLRC